MADTDAPPTAIGRPNLWDMSLRAGFEIDKSRLRRPHDNDVVWEFGKQLKAQATRISSVAGVGFVHPRFAEPMNRLYRLEHDGRLASGGVVHDFVVDIAEKFENFDANIGDVEKTALVDLSAKMFEVLSIDHRLEESMAAPSPSV